MLEPILIDYFDTLRVLGDQLPKLNSFEVRRSSLKMKILEWSNDTMDISDVQVFTELNVFFAKYRQKLKELGLASTDKQPRIPQESVDVIHKFLKHLTNLMMLPDDHPTYLYHLQQIPTDHQHSYHYLALHGAVYVVLSHLNTERRGEFDSLRKDQVLLQTGKVTH